jgi:hypothetical protein
VARIDGACYTTLAEAIAAGSNATVKLLKDVTGDVTINVSNLTLDLNNKTINGNVVVSSEGVTIKDGNITNNSDDTIDVIS